MFYKLTQKMIRNCSYIDPLTIFVLTLILFTNLNNKKVDNLIRMGVK
jgi:hypothetical protein